MSVAEEVAVSTDYAVKRRVLWQGRVYAPGDKAPVSMLEHPRFESLVSTGIIGMVLR